MLHFTKPKRARHLTDLCFRMASEASSLPLAKRSKVEPTWCVVKSEYPSRYGANAGSWASTSMVDIMKMELTELEYQTTGTSIAFESTDKVAALAEARDLRDGSEWFEADENDDVFGKLPPYCSADLKNHDSDNEVLIQVMTEDAFAAFDADRKKRIEMLRGKLKRKVSAREAREKETVKAAGRVFYKSCGIKSDIDIPAELELQLDEGTFRGIEAATAAKVKTLMLREGSAHHSDTTKPARISDVEFAELLAKFTSLEELHWQNAQVSMERVQAVVSRAPSLAATLTTLSIRWAKRMEPDALQLCGAFFKSVRDLNLEYSLSTEHFDESVHGYDDWDHKPFDTAIAACQEGMLQLKKIEFGCGDGESKTIFFRYTLNNDIVQELKRKSGGKKIQVLMTSY